MSQYNNPMMFKQYSKQYYQERKASHFFKVVMTMSVLINFLMFAQIFIMKFKFTFGNWIFMLICVLNFTALIIKALIFNNRTIKSEQNITIWWLCCTIGKSSKGKYYTQLKQLNQKLSKRNRNGKPPVKQMDSNRITARTTLNAYKESLQATQKDLINHLRISVKSQLDYSDPHTFMDVSSSASMENNLNFRAIIRQVKQNISIPGTPDVEVFKEDDFQFNEGPKEEAANRERSSQATTSSKKQSKTEKMTQVKYDKILNDQNQIKNKIKFIKYCNRAVQISWTMLIIALIVYMWYALFISLSSSHLLKLAAFSAPGFPESCDFVKMKNCARISFDSPDKQCLERRILHSKFLCSFTNCDQMST